MRAQSPSSLSWALRSVRASGLRVKGLLALRPRGDATIAFVAFGMGSVRAEGEALFGASTPSRAACSCKLRYGIMILWRQQFLATKKENAEGLKPALARP